MGHTSPFYCWLFRAISLCLLLPAFFSFALQLQQVKLDENYKQTDVFSITEDKDGYLWLGTINGLYRYDGREFIGYQTDSHDPSSLSNNLSRVVFSASDGNLWVGTQQGLNRYLPNTSNFKRYPLPSSERDYSVVWGIFESPTTQQLYVSTDHNLFRWVQEEDRFIPLLPAGQDSVEIKSLEFLADGRLLVASYDRGLFFIEPDFSAITAHPDNQKLIEKGVVLHQLQRTNQNDFQINTSSGLYQLNATNWSLEQVDNNLYNIQVRSSVKAANSAFWFGTEKGLFVQPTPLSPTTPLLVNGLSKKPYIYTLFKDKYGNIWAGGRSFLGLHRAGTEPFVHQEIDVADSAQSSSSNIIAVEASEQGAYLLTATKKIIFIKQSETAEQILTNLPDDIELLINSRIKLDPKKQKLWFNSKNGLFSFSLSNYELHQHNIIVGNHPMASYFDFTLDKNGAVWIANKQDDLLKYTPETGKTVQYKLATNNQYSLETLTFDSDENLWIGTEHGVFLFSPKTQQFKPIDIGQNVWVTNITVNARGIWLGTMVNGLFHLSHDRKNVAQLTKESGLTDNSICNILSSPNDDIWLTSNYGISLIRSDSIKARSFNRFNSVYLAEYNQHAGTISPSGKIYFGGQNGLISFNPQDIQPMPFQGKVHLHELRVFNQVVTPNDSQGRLKSSVDTLKSINLLYSDSPFSLKFGYPYPSGTESTVYKYRLKGQDEQWLTTNHTNTVATYTNLSPGGYTFEVMAQSMDGLWQSGITQVKVHIAPPYWRSPGAYTLYFFALSLLMVMIFRNRQQKRLVQIRIAESEERLKLSLWGSGDELWDWHIKANKIYRSNIWGLLEFPHDGYRSKTEANEDSNIHPRDIKRVQQALCNHIEGKTNYFEATYRVRNSNSDWLWILDRGKVVERDTSSHPLRMTGTIKDISKLKEAEHRLTLFARSIANISDGVFILNKHFRIIEVNDAFTTISGFSKQQVLNHSLMFRSYSKNFNQQVKSRLSQQGQWIGELEDTRQDGTRFYLDLAIDPITSEEGDISHYVGVFSDITRRKEAECELHRLSVEDTLTKLPNRSWFQAEHHKLVSKKTLHALMVLDLDNFKKVNDSLGHQAGDDLLIQVAGCLDGAIRNQDTLFRLGGDEYAVLLENTTDINTITQTVKNLQKVLEKPFKVAHQELGVSCSIGIVLFPLDGSTSEELLRNADTAMYHAKSHGSNSYTFFSAPMNESAMHQLHIESMLRQAIRDDLFNLFYQPKFSSATNELHGMEALIRLHHPEHGPISPAQFIPLAEESGLIIEIGDIVLKKACFAAQSWRRQGLLNGKVAVNVSAKQFASNGFVSRVERALEISGFPAHCLELELTEGALVEDPEGAIVVMQQLRKLGIHISLDDFGTGYSSLAYLQRFPIDTLKIDQSFVRNMSVSESGLNMVSSIIALAHNLNLSVIAEGVETDTERQLLAEMECETLQGYLLSRPLSETDFSAFLYIQSSAQEQAPSRSQLLT